jgi:N-acetylglutamate synthase-like GNAT family acetyltransferase
MNVVPAETRHLPAILDLLARSDLPTSGVQEHLDSFVVAESDSNNVVGVGGFEPYDRTGLLRSIAVAPDRRKKGVATAICDRLEDEAARRGIEELYLLTETAESFFAARGYRSIPRTDAPPEVASCQEFRSLCPASAVLMTRRSTAS